MRREYELSTLSIDIMVRKERYKVLKQHRVQASFRFIDKESLPRIDSINEVTRQVQHRNSAQRLLIKPKANLLTINHVSKLKRHFLIRQLQSAIRLLASKHFENLCKATLQSYTVRMDFATVTGGIDP